MRSELFPRGNAWLKPAAHHEMNYTHARTVATGLFLTCSVSRASSGQLLASSVVLPPLLGYVGDRCQANDLRDLVLEVTSIK